MKLCSCWRRCLRAPPTTDSLSLWCRYERERVLTAELKVQLAECSTRYKEVAGLPVLPPQLPVGVPQRRHTLPGSAMAGLAQAAEALGQLAGAPSRPRQDAASGGDGAEELSLQRLGSALTALVLLQGTGQEHEPYGPRLTRQQTEGGEHTTVSVADDGTSGVGAAAAAAVSVALAQSWAAVAGGKSFCFPEPSVAAIPGKARFKLVAAVPRNNKQGSRMPLGPTSPASARDVPLAGLDPLDTTGRDSSMDDHSGAGFHRSPSSALHPNGAAWANSLALESLHDAKVLDDSQEASWRSSGSHLKLQWLSPPSTVMVVYKPAHDVLQAASQAVAWLLRRGLTVYVEPGAHAEIVAATRQALAAGGWNAGSHSQVRSSSALSSMGSVSSDLAGTLGSPPRTVHNASMLASAASGEAAHLPVHGAAPGDTPAAEAGGEYEAAEQLVREQLRTWGEDACACANTVPPQMAARMDLVLTLGGDGTVLWACSLFSAGAVPPVVPLAMGSLGFMTPFPISRMGTVLSRVTSVDHGFPLMLRHRLKARILRAGASGADLAYAAVPPCGEDVVVLNEVVIDRGMTPSLANLQCYVDHNFVTAIQGDGLIVATPTGSTAYNLAAGGSMVHPSVPCLLFTPICPHTLSSRPLVFPEHVTLRVKVPEDSRGEAYCSFDGKARQALRPGDSVLIHLSHWPVPMVCNLDASHDWFLSVREGLNWNRRQVQKPA